MSKLIEINHSEYVELYSMSYINKVDDQIDYYERESYNNDNRLICVKVVTNHYDVHEQLTRVKTTYWKPTN